MAQSVTAEENSTPTALIDYVNREDGAFKWTLDETKELPQGKIYNIQLTSQKWQNIVWTHAVEIYEPNEIKYPNHVLLMVTGGRNGGKTNQGDMERGLALAKLCRARVAIIHQVPNQPLFDGRVEDDLITETWLRYLKTGDESWPLLFPMVKSAAKAMDAVQACAKENWNTAIDGFVITGGSKRGWTSWLTPVCDSRVIATAPLVIDFLNFKSQFKHQIDTWGDYSPQIADYTRKGLVVQGEESPRVKQLRLMMDPYTYREQLSLPKLLVHGTNDPYWVVDAAKWYWDDLLGPKYILQVPNAGHGLDGGVELALSTIAVFFQHTVSGTPMPAITWKHSTTDQAADLLVQFDQAPMSARLWTADSDDKDFRDEEWISQGLELTNGDYTATITKNANLHIAYYMELQYEFGGIPYSLCTLIYRD